MIPLILFLSLSANSIRFGSHPHPIGIRPTAPVLHYPGNAR